MTVQWSPYSQIPFYAQWYNDVVMVHVLILSIQDQLAEVYQFQVDAEAVLSIPHSPGLASQLEELVKRAEALDVVVPEMTKLRVVCEPF